MRFATDFAEIVLVVENVQAAAKFYEDVVGLTLQEPADETWAWFWLGEPDMPRRLALHKGARSSLKSTRPTRKVRVGGGFTSP